ncbi:MAG: flippase-like domain-containing protein [Lachnospiraceae bacterium]|nr:flippase-like domain-containing protein [Lachnospiraceae bacterium]
MKKSEKKWIGTFIKIVISAVLLTILVMSADIEEIGEALAGFKAPWGVAVILAIALSVYVSALKWGELLKAQGVRISSPKLFGYYICGLFFNNFLPSSIGGDGARAILAGQEGGTVGGAASVVMERILATVTLAILGLVSAVFSRHPAGIVLILMGTILAAGLLLAVVQLTGWVPERLKKSEGKIAGVWKTFALKSTEIRRHPKAIAISLLESLIFQILVAVVVETVIAGLGLQLLPLPDLCMVVSASSVLAMVPVGLNGYGLREGSYAFLLAPYGYSTAQALTISVLYALFVTLFSLAGGPLWLVLKKKKEIRT